MIEYGAFSILFCQVFDMELNDPSYSDYLNSLPNFYANSEAPCWLAFPPPEASWLGEPGTKTETNDTDTDLTDTDLTDTEEVKDEDLSSDENEISTARSGPPITLILPPYEQAGLRDIESAVSKVFRNVSLSRSLVCRANAIYKMSVDLQKNQKDSPQTSRRSTNTLSKFFRRKVCVLTSIIIAMKQLGLHIANYDDTKAKTRDRYDISVLNRFINGQVNVGIQSVKTCCRDLGFTSFRLT